MCIKESEVFFIGLYIGISLFYSVILISQVNFFSLFFEGTYVVDRKLHFTRVDTFL